MEEEEEDEEEEEEEEEEPFIDGELSDFAFSMCTCTIYSSYNPFNMYWPVHYMYIKNYT